MTMVLTRNPQANRTYARHIGPETDDWREQAACIGEDPELWFPVVLDYAATTGAHPQVAYAVSVCNRCPVRPQCRDYAVTTGIDHGVWAGLTPHERRQRHDTPAEPRGPVQRPQLVTTPDGRLAATWSADDDELLTRRWREGWQMADIAAELGRTKSATATRRKKLALPARTSPGAASSDWRHDPMLVQRLRRYAAAGAADGRIASAVGISRSQVQYLRGKWGIAAAHQPGRARRAES